MAASPGSPDVRFASISLDFVAPADLANFYVALLGGQLLWSGDGSAAVQVSGLLMVMQGRAGYENQPPPEMLDAVYGTANHG
ncbi:hypothetical protein SAMN06265360_11417 [Haloechinothrix alba]|uniref:Glyoxalase-like domain-containing protein n=1 Tax=Haloechinothrix alba TaxID=664784 RepID=A0A238Y6T8_9PSEU|nr:hypothetical protein SAMN06265360_11417 [Haloechinothrix alba]